jgi:hypothetical protein
LSHECSEMLSTELLHEIHPSGIDPTTRCRAADRASSRTKS